MWGKFVAQFNRKPDIQLNIATYMIHGELNDASAQEIINRIENHLHILRGLHVEGLLLSFAEITKIDKDALFRVINSFSRLHVKMRAVIGFCDYTGKIFPILRHLIKSSPLGLYESVDTMALAIGTSNASRELPILVYSDNIDERQLIASTLISNNYFVIIAVSKSDLEVKSHDKKRFNRIIKESYFSHIHDNVMINFENNIFSYEFQGTLDNTLSSRINVDDYMYRLSQGYNVVIFDFTRIYHMNLQAALFLIELEKKAQPYKALICAIELSNDKVDINAFGALKRSEIWLFESINHIYADAEVIEKTTSRLPRFGDGVSKKLLELAPNFIAATMQTLNIYEIPNPNKSHLKQINTKQLYSIKYKVATIITFCGDFEGEFIFLFTQESADILIKHILVDHYEYDEEEYLDAIGEFVDSLAGKLKSNLRKKNRGVKFTPAESTTNLEDIIHKKSLQTFILTNFQCDGKDYYAALTSPMEGHYDVV